MNSYKFLIILSLITSITLLSCEKEKVSKYTSINDFHRSYFNPKVYSFDANQDIDIVGEKGTKLFIPKSATSYLDGKVYVHFQEYLKKSDLLLNNIPTNASRGRMLETGGSFYVAIFNADNERVLVNGSMELSFPIRDGVSNPDGMGVWYGDYDVEETRPIFEIWRDDDLADSDTVIRDSSSNQYRMSFSRYNWINCDYVFDTQNDAEPLVVFIDNDKLELNELNTFIVFHNINSVLRLNQSQGNFTSMDIPIGEELSIVSIGYSNGEFYFIDKHIPGFDGSSATIELIPIEEEDLIQSIMKYDQ